ncbi:MAG TPA: hypothetical protein PKD54_06025 [Pirellulaceae bacterium]|nr:hypothetical protein [Pirellulaceae bacterium]
MSDSFEERGKALEEHFFRQKNQELLEKLRRELDAKEQVEALSHVSGITDSETLELLVENGISAETLVCVSLIPLIEVAWADGSVQPEERKAILAAAQQTHIVPDSASFALLEHWMTQRPTSELLESWHHYMRSVKSKLNETSFNQMKTNILKRAYEIADAAGGFLGIGRVSLSEKRVLSKLEKMLDD